MLKDRRKKKTAADSKLSKLIFKLKHRLMLSLAEKAACAEVQKQQALT